MDYLLIFGNNWVILSVSFVWEGWKGSYWVLQRKNRENFADPKIYPGYFPIEMVGGCKAKSISEERALAILNAMFYKRYKWTDIPVFDELND